MQPTAVPHLDRYLDALTVRKRLLEAHKTRLEKNRLLPKATQEVLPNQPVYPKWVNDALQQDSVAYSGKTISLRHRYRWHQTSVTRLSDVESHTIKFADAQTKGFLLLAVTLNTTVTEKIVADGEMFEKLWSKHFLGKIDKHLPKHRGNHLYHHDYTIELSDGTQQSGEVPASFWQAGFWHFHGILAIRPDASPYVWRDGSLNNALARDLRSFKTKGKYRLCAIPSTYIAPVSDLAGWLRYIHKRRQQKIPVC